jgi:Flp pilus assembly protein TadG
MLDRAARRLGRLRGRASQESGVVLVLVAIMMIVFLGMAAMAVDLGSFYHAQKQAQSAADAGALAAADDLAAGASAASTVGSQYATANDPDGTPTVSTPYNGSPTQVKVTVNVSAPAFFGKVLGIQKANVSASAVAGAQATGAPAAVFAGDSSCGSSVGLLLGTNGGLTIPGGVHSNGSITASNSGGVYGPSTYGGPSGCSFNPNSGTTQNGTCVNSYNSACAPTVDSKAEPYPVDYRNTFFTNPASCTFSGTDKNFQNDDGATLANGTYCFQTIEFNSGNLKCTCTFWASQSFTFNDTNQNFTPDFGNLTFYYSGTGSLNINSNGNSWLLNGGTIFAPYASVTINTPGTGVSGFVEAYDVTLNGNGPTVWTGTGPSSGTGSSALLQ